MKYIFLSFALFALSAKAENATTAANTSTTQTTTITSTGKVHGVADFRPSYMGKTGEVHTETAAELGYDFKPGASLFYRQEFTTNVYNPGNVNGINSIAGDGYIKGMNYNLLPIDGTNLTLGYEGRVFLPTVERKRDAGMLTAIRNYFWVKYAATNSLNFYVAEVPVLHVYNQVGSGNAANPVFENKVELVGEYNFNKDLRLVVPIKYGITKHSSYKVGAKNNDAWVNNVYIYPELHYKLTPNFRVGAAVYTGALMNESLSGFTLEEGFRNSTFQTFVIATL